METKEQYLKLKQEWAEAHNIEEKKYNFSLAHYCIYAELRGRSWKTCLAETTRESTLHSLSPTWASHWFAQIASKEKLSEICDKINKERKEML